VSRRATAEEQRAPSPAAPERPRAEAPRLLQLQRQAGNRAVGRILARLVDPPDTTTKDKAEATARATRTRLRTELLPHMVGHANALVRNTAEFFSGAEPLLTLDAITKRSDSDEKMRKPPAGFDPNLYDVFFLGTSMDNDDYHQKAMTGTLSGTTMYLRGHDMSLNVQDLDTMAYSVVHEVSHFLVKQYGELPGTGTDAASFDRTPTSSGPTGSSRTARAPGRRPPTRPRPSANTSSARRATRPRAIPSCTPRTSSPATTPSRRRSTRSPDRSATTPATRCACTVCGRCSPPSSATARRSAGSSRSSAH
jgi:hypothetical protein